MSLGWGPTAMKIPGRFFIEWLINVTFTSQFWGYRTIESITVSDCADPIIVTSTSDSCFKLCTGFKFYIYVSDWSTRGWSNMYMTFIRTQRELKNAPLVGGFWAAVASVWYLKYFCKSYIYFSQCDIVSICSDSPASPTGDRWETENAEHLNINKLFLLLAILPPHKYSGLILTKYLQ